MIMIISSFDPGVGKYMFKYQQKRIQKVSRAYEKHEWFVSHQSNFTFSASWSWIYVYADVTNVIISVVEIKQEHFLMSILVLIMTTISCDGYMRL